MDDQQTDIRDWNSVLRDAILHRLEFILVEGDFDVPTARMHDARWLARNLAVRNSANPQLADAQDLIRALLRRGA